MFPPRKRCPGLPGHHREGRPRAECLRPHPDQPVFTPENIRYLGERIAAVAAVDEDTAVEAVEKIKLDIEEQEAVFDPARR